MRPDVAPAQAVKTFIHELGHALLHSEELPRSKEVAEVEVESVAYIVCNAIGLDSGNYSFAYVARWAEGSSELLRETGERVIACARTILNGLELPGHLQNLRIKRVIGREFATCAFAGKGRLTRAFR